MKKFGYNVDKTLLFYDVDVSNLFTESMKYDLLKAIRESVQTRFMTFHHDTCRENEDVKSIPAIYCSGLSLSKKIEWLENFYKNQITKVVSTTLDREVKPVNDIGRAITVQVLGHGMRIECHIDTYPTAANLYLKTAPRGGELAISPERNTKGYQNILNEAETLVPLTEMTLGIVHLNNNAHTVTYCWDNVNEEVPLLALPNLDDKNFWAGARIALNFNFDDPLFAESMPSSEERISIYNHIHGGSSKVN